MYYSLFVLFGIIHLSSAVLPPYIGNGLPNTLQRNDIIGHYFSLGLAYSEILAFHFHGMEISLRQLNRVLRRQGLRRRKDHRAYGNINWEYLALKYGDLCSACKRVKEETEAGVFFCLCRECPTSAETRKSLELNLGEANQELRVLARALRNVIEWTFRTWQKNRHSLNGFYLFPSNE